jgi:hypothetical protein
MKFLSMFLAVAAFNAASQDIIVSKDSLWVYNGGSHPGRNLDSATIVNNGSQAIRLDSARIVLHDWYVMNPPRSATHAQAVISENHNGNRLSDYFTVDSISATEYNLNFSPISWPLLSIGPHDSIIVSDFQIGWNFFGNLPVFPQYVTGILRLYFSNGQTVSLRFFSDDHRPAAANLASPVTRDPAAPGKNRRFLINGQKMPDKTAGMIVKGFCITRAEN